MSTKDQRAEILRLLKKQEMDITTLTYQHRTLGVPDYLIGKPVDLWIEGLSTEHASSVIRQLRDRADEQEPEEA